MRTARSHRLALTALGSGVVLLLGPAASAGEDGAPEVELSVERDEASSHLHWSVTLDVEHSQPTDKGPWVEWAVDGYNTHKSPWPITVAEGSSQSPQCEADRPTRSSTVLDDTSRVFDAIMLPGDTDRVMVFGAYCDTEGVAHRIEVEAYLTEEADGTFTVEQYPLVDVPDEDAPEDDVPEEDDDAEGPIVDTGWTGDSALSPLAALTGAALLGAGGTTVAASRRRA